MRLLRSLGGVLKSLGEVGWRGDCAGLARVSGSRSFGAGRSYGTAGPKESCWMMRLFSVSVVNGSQRRVTCRIGIAA